MDELLKRARRFGHESYAEMREHFAALAEGQQPHTLLITCSDSRVDPQLITGSLPGELFVVRNVANSVSRYGGELRCSGSAAIEYAVLVLGVERVVVLGHSGCGGCAALSDPATIREDMLHLREWCAQRVDVMDEADRMAEAGLGRSPAERIEQANVLRQIENLRTYPFVAEREASRRLRLCGWYYRIGTGEVIECTPGGGCG